MIERLCIQADIPKPKIAVADMAMPNAFAMGRSKKSAVVCATTGIMNTLEPHELEGVMAHELAHIKNRDVLIMTMAGFFASIALSRYREFTADRGAAIITGRPSALASALMKINSQMHRIPQQDLRAAGEMNAFFIMPAAAKNAVTGLFSTHPPMEKRIERLQRIEAELQQSAGQAYMAA
jgi:heat shock protein HtpX